MDVKRLLSRCKANIRLLGDYHVPEEVRISRVKAFLEEVIRSEYEHIKILDQRKQSVFDLLCRDIIRQSKEFIRTSGSIRDAKALLHVIMSVERYLEEVERKPWKLGKRLSALEKYKLRRIFRKELHNAYDPKTNRPVRGTHVKVVLTGSLARGHSDWKPIPGTDIPKPSDYGTPREYRKATKSIYKKLDAELRLPSRLKPLMSDVDLLIVNEVIYDSVNPAYSENGWSFKLGGKYPTGVGASGILGRIHQKLTNIKIGGAMGRWVNYILVRDEKGHRRYLSDRRNEIEKLRKKTKKEIDVTDVTILDEKIR